MNNKPVNLRKQIALHPHKIVSITQIANDVFTIELERQFDFIAGQVVALSNHANDEAPRLYSIASGTQQPFIRILFDVNPEGCLTPKLAKMQKGETLYVSKPFGKFIDNNEPSWWIATGTGIAPFISMIESGITTNKTLIHGARTLDKFYFSDLFTNTLASHYHRFCTTETSPLVQKGRLTNFLKEQNQLNPNIKYYLCGNSQMVIEVREILVEQKQIPWENVIAEIYF